MDSLDKPSTIAQQIGHAPLLAGLRDSDRQQIVDAAEHHICEADVVVVRQGTVSQNVWLLLDGRCNVVKEPSQRGGANPVVIAEIAPLDTFGEMTFFTEKPHATSVLTRERCTALKLSRTQFEQLEHDAPEIACRLACNLVNILGDRLRRMDEWLTDLLDGHEDAALHEKWVQLSERLRRRFPRSAY